ncbi:hypothetical protein M9H77_15292 [Catharanthus roseus]|uniref:Uncharacterized protein n=1 Tax=Catharanthus roseus TaxID=4058 RepID=A0ACC0AX34_CATRO|nr:hypothetical protein M9H77_15292 [Catharanthus roseus]
MDLASVVGPDESGQELGRTISGKSPWVVDPMLCPNRRKQKSFSESVKAAMAEENPRGITFSSPAGGKGKEEGVEKSVVRHEKETHGKSEEIDEKTPIEQVKGPNVFHRVKEEVEAVVQSVLPNKD